MKILLVSANYPPAIGGPASTVPIIAEELIKLGHDVDVLTQGINNYKDKKRKYNLIRAKEKFPVKRENNFQILKLIFSLSKEVKKLCKEKKYDIIHCHDLNISSLSVMLSGVKNKKIAKFTGDLALEYYCKIKKNTADTLSFNKFEKQNTFLKTFLRKLQSFIGERMDLITAPSNFIKNSLVNASNIKKNKVIIFRNGAKRIKGKKKKRINSKLFCALKLEPKKNVGAAIDSLTYLPKKYKLIIAGNGSEKKKLKNLVKSKKLDKRVKFLGFINHKKVIEELLTSFAFILPSIYEPASVSLYDAMSAQTPIIATKVGGTPEIITNNKTGILVPPFNSKRIAEAVKKLENNNLYKKIQKIQKKEIEKYYWNKNVKRLEKIYKNLIICS